MQAAKETVQRFLYKQKKLSLRNLSDKNLCVAFTNQRKKIASDQTQHLVPAQPKWRKHKAEDFFFGSCEK